MSTLKSVALFELMATQLQGEVGKGVVEKVDAVYHFELRKTKASAPQFITLDLKNGSDKITFAKEGKADAAFSMLDDDFIKLTKGQLKPQNAFMTGKMKIKGNLKKAMKFNPSVLPAGAKL